MIKYITGLQQRHKGLCSEGYFARVCGGSAEKDPGYQDRRPVVGEHPNGSPCQPTSPRQSPFLCQSGKE